MKQREFGWHVIWYNLRMSLKNSNKKESNFFVFQIKIYVILDKAENRDF